MTPQHEHAVNKTLSAVNLNLDLMGFGMKNDLVYLRIDYLSLFSSSRDMSVEEFLEWMMQRNIGSIVYWDTGSGLLCAAPL